MYIGLNGVKVIFNSDKERKSKGKVAMGYITALYPSLSTWRFRPVTERGSPAARDCLALRNLTNDF